MVLARRAGRCDRGCRGRRTHDLPVKHVRSPHMNYRLTVLAFGFLAACIQPNVDEGSATDGAVKPPPADASSSAGGQGGDTSAAGGSGGGAAGSGGGTAGS